MSVFAAFLRVCIRNTYSAMKNTPSNSLSLGTLPIAAILAVLTANTAFCGRLSQSNANASPPLANPNVVEKNGTLIFTGRVTRNAPAIDVPVPSSETAAALQGSSEVSAGQRKAAALQGPPEVGASQRKADALRLSAEISAEMLLKERKPEAIAAFEKAAAAGSSWACYELARLYLSGQGSLGLTKDTDKALLYYKKGAERRHIACLDELGDIYAEGREGVAANPSKAAEYYRAGNVHGEGCPGTRMAIVPKLLKLYSAGIGLPQDTDLAIEYMEGLKECPGTALLARLYLAKGERTDDPEKAKQYYEKAVATLERRDPNDAEAIYLLSRLTAEGTGVAQNKSAADALLSEAVDKGSLAAKFEVERPTIRSGATPPDEATLKRVRDAATAGSPQAQFELASLLIEGVGMEKNAARAFALLKSSAKSGNLEASYALGKAYASGSLGRKNPEKALGLLEAAAARGHVGAALEAARIYQRGLAGAPDPDKAIKLFTQAAAGGEGEAHLAFEGAAHLALAKIFSAGRIATPDPSLAAQHYLEAAKLGDKDARIAVLKFFFTGRSAERRDAAQPETIAYKIRRSTDSELVFEFAKEYAETGLPAASYYLGTCYAEGIGVEKNPTEALACLSKASGSENSTPSPKASDKPQPAAEAGSAGATTIQ